jgi:NAD(P)-dependent dehydrogenase (short-subunit alcohol dehydrogenase family)
MRGDHDAGSTIGEPTSASVPHAGRARDPVTTAAVVTGAASGIGLAVAQGLVRDGVSVVAVDIDVDGLEHARKSLGHLFRPVVGDIGDWSTHERAADVAQSCGELRYWVNNAGIDWVGATHEIDEEHITTGVRILQIGPMFGICVAVRRMLPGRCGSIVNVSSIQGLAAFPEYIVYGAAKAAIIMMTRSIAVDYGNFGIRCNAVLPGCIETPMSFGMFATEAERDAAIERESALAPMQRIGQPEEIAATVLFLLSEKASYVNGAGLVADGGASARVYAYPPLGLG